MNPRAGHRVACHPHKERGRRVFDEVPVGVERALDIVVGRRRKACEKSPKKHGQLIGGRGTNNEWARFRRPFGSQ